MPIPQPKEGESRNDFISRCAGDAMMNKEYPNTAQRVAICSVTYRRSKQK